MLNMLIGLSLGYVLYKIILIFLRKKEKRIDEAECYRRDLGLKLISFFLEKEPVPYEDWEEWIKIAKFSDDLYFRACPFMKSAEKLEDTARKIFANRISN